MPQHNSQEENAKYIEELIAKKKSKLQTTMDKLEKIDEELQESGYYVEPEEEKIPVQLSQQQKTTAIHNLTEQNRQDSINQKRLSKLQAIQMQLEQLDRELRKAQKVDDTLRELQQKVEESQAENILLQKKLSEKEATIKELSSQLSVISELEQMVTKMRYQLEKTQEEALLFQDLASKTKSELAATKENSQSLEKNLSQVETQSNELQEILKNTQEQFTSLKKRVESDLEPTIIQYKEKVKEQETKLQLTDSLSQTIRHLHTMIDEAKNENNTLRQNFASERDHLSEERLQVKDMFARYQQIHAELVAIAVELLHKGQILPIIDKSLRQQTYGWAIECILEDVKSGEISEREMKKIFNAIDEELMIASLKTIPDYEIPAKEHKTITIEKIVREVERKPEQKKDPAFVEDRFGIFRYLLRV